MNTFEYRYHSIDTTSTLNTLVNSPTSHFSSHLKTRRNAINSEIYICLFLIEPTLKIYKENKPLEQACHGLLESVTPNFFAVVLTRTSIMRRKKNNTQHSLLTHCMLILHLTNLNQNA